MYGYDCISEGPLLYMAIGWAVLSGVYAFNVFRHGGPFLSMWFEVFSGGTGLFAILLIVFLSPSRHPTIFLVVFWGIVIVIVGGIWWLERSRKKR